MKVTNSFSPCITYHKLHITFLHFYPTSGLHVIVRFFIFSTSFFFCLYCFCVHICLSLPSTFLRCHYAFFSSYSYPLLLVLNFYFFAVHRFFLSFAFICFSFCSSLRPSTFRSLCLVQSFPACFYSLFLSSLSNFTFSPSLLHFSLPTNQCFLLSSFLIFSCNLFPLMISKTPKLTPCTRYDVISAHLL